ncbi:hypothetical protein M409DRAFT_29633 [Zasmidium cellare ATCC 36951]|uniref:Uncharacterized protein n=1 Tax=Zasmidium cellare ATCC 36951 TaxID=1080233 RepID=A0A6A6C1W5_ZASCE|nr:uncharacterized protein M409DRAFT_29633 [Zasmidium cellare ATCC 36951]KAF2159822.1 hypothetical protein M409DRAFT_29633 [Zasmidium cellare ATCC 36951]
MASKSISFGMDTNLLCTASTYDLPLLKHAKIESTFLLILPLPNLYTHKYNMLFFTIIATALATAAAANPLDQPLSGQALQRRLPQNEGQRTPPSKYYGISLNINMKPIGEQPEYGRAPVELNMLAQYTIKASEIIFDQGVHVNLELSTVLCQAYSDVDGVVPLGKPFSASESLYLAQEPVQLGSVLCYVSGDT